MWKKVLIGLLVLFLAIQLLRPAKDQGLPPGPNDLIVRTDPDPGIKQLLVNTCYDCHSNQTRYPWYTEVQPFGWWIAHHVKEGKSHLNFSTLGELSPKRAAQKLEQCADEVSEGEMPLASYKLAHPAARLTPAQRKLLSNWFGIERAKYQPE
ncbi:MAG: heme-binding domain-containing protein [Nibricoccus sp.]